MFGRVKQLLSVATLSLGALMGAQQANAGVIDLGFALDGSGSVGSTNWNLQTQGFADALDLLSLDSTYRVTFVHFASAANVIVGPTVIDSVATLNAVKSSLTGYAYSGGTTNTSSAIDLIMSEWTTAGFDAADKQYINISTDGNPNRPGTSANARQEALNSASNAVAAGLDSLSAEAVGNNIDLNFLLDLISPAGAVYTAADTLPDPTVSSFVLEIDNFNDFGAAVEKKLAAIVNVPEPSLAFLFAGALALFGLRRRKA